jgi:hypothetical protein
MAAIATFCGIGFLRHPIVGQVSRATRVHLVPRLYAAEARVGRSLCRNAVAWL